MERQLIISVGREFGSGGHAIAEELARRFSLPFYDHNLMDEMAREKGIEIDTMIKYDEVPRKPFLSQTVRGFNNSPEENLANMQFDYLRQKAVRGESFVIEGRCAETVLKDFEGLIKIFVLGDMDKKIERIAKLDNVSKTAAARTIRIQDRKRRAYHNYYSEMKWGDSRGYDISINSSRLGLEATADVLEDYIRRRLSEMGS